MTVCRAIARRPGQCDIGNSFSLNINSDSRLGQEAFAFLFHTYWVGIKSSLFRNICFTCIMKPDSILMLDFAQLSSRIMPPPLPSQIWANWWESVALLSLGESESHCFQWLYSPWNLCSPWNSPGQTTGVGSLSPGDLPNPGIEPRSPTLKANSSPAESQWEIQTMQLPIRDHMWEATS